MPIGKLGLLDLTNSIEDEWLCSKLTHAFGLPAAETEIHHFKDQKVLVVKRFDRTWSQENPSILLRIPHESLYQATGTSSALKYESDGSPDMLQVLEFLAGANDPTDDRRVFLQALMVNWLLGAPDAHAKNYSLREGYHREDNRSC